MWKLIWMNARVKQPAKTHKEFRKATKEKPQTKRVFARTSTAKGPKLNEI